MEIITESAFAKINLTLDVLGKRPDGYHDIRSIMQTISLRDDVVINVDTDAPWAVHCYREVIEDPKAEQSEVRLETDGFPQDADNLAWRAAEAFFARTGKRTSGLEIFINKRIPTEAGLGGGSADAALAELKKRGCSNIKLMVLVAAPEGIRMLREKHPDVDIYCGAVDDHLNEHGYIVPGLGDAGDRIFGTK